jgi:hypothetical protein
MPVIRGTSTATVLTADRRNALFEELAQELSGQRVKNGPLIFEIPLEQSNRMDVLVVWEAFEGILSEERTGLILEVYKDQKGKIAQALGVTYGEALEQHLLPYSVVPMTRRGKADPNELRQAMLDEGAVSTADEKVDLRFPTMAMAESAHQRLCERLPQGYWSIAQSLAPVS